MRQTLAVGQELEQAATTWKISSSSNPHVSLSLGKMLNTERPLMGGLALYVAAAIIGV